MNINQELVEKLRNGEITIRNGNIQMLRQVLKAAFPKDKTDASGYFELYRKCGINKTEWTPVEGTDAPIVPLSDFFLPTLKMIPVEELERLIINRDVWLESFDDHKKGMNALFDKLQEKINKYK